jgi:hypothetical protein
MARMVPPGPVFCQPQKLRQYRIAVKLAIGCVQNAACLLYQLGDLFNPVVPHMYKSSPGKVMAVLLSALRMATRKSSSTIQVLAASVGNHRHQATYE